MKCPMWFVYRKDKKGKRRRIMVATKDPRTIGGEYDQYRPSDELVKCEGTLSCFIKTEIDGHVHSPYANIVVRYVCSECKDSLTGSMVHPALPDGVASWGDGGLADFVNQHMDKAVEDYELSHREREEVRPGSAPKKKGK